MAHRVQVSSEIDIGDFINNSTARIMKDFDIKILSMLLMLYVGLQIIFGLDSNVLYSNILNLLLLGYYLLVAIYRKHNGIYLGKSSVLFTLFTIVCIISAGWAADWTKSVSWFRSLIIINVNILLFYEIISRYKLSRFILYGFILGGLFNHLIALNLIEYVNPHQLKSIRFLGTVANPNILSTIILLAFISSGIILNKTKNIFIKVFHLSNMVLCFYIVFLSMSRKGIFIAFVLVLILLYKNLRSIKGVFSMVFLVIAFVLLSPKIERTRKLSRQIELNIDRIGEIGIMAKGGNIGSGGIRLEYLNLGFDLIIRSPIWGYGFNNFSHFTGFHYSHNNYIEILTGTGLIGFVLFYLIHFNVFKRLKKIRNDDLKILIYGALIVILIGDLGTVSYLKKHTMIMLVFLDAYSLNLARSTDN